MKNNFIKSLVNSLNSRKRKRKRKREVSQGDLSMKKESNGIGENKNSKKISKNNKIISSILAVAMCCQSLVGAVKPDSQLVDSKEIDSKKNVEITEDKNENKDESKKDDAVNKSKWLLILWLSILAKTIAGISVLGVGALVIYDAISSKKKEEEPMIGEEEPMIGEEEPMIGEEEPMIGEIEIDGKTYKTCNIGRFVDEDGFGGGRYENLDESGSLWKFKKSIRVLMCGGEEQKSVINIGATDVSFHRPNESNSVKEEVMEQLESEYSKFIYKIMTGGEAIENAEPRAYKLLCKDNKDNKVGYDFCLVNIVFYCFLVPKELVEALKNHGYKMYILEARKI
ncbi:MAG: hypothetical protein CfP315_0781 [Candidatus Improbicoccus pseudotrichonymphae]|uniref:Uncharacterized protein n=1 Tax=Candidatus Improbicoccus pseudotrichonymphae TaxID=3033792 RepID=A0AA48I8S7_9FIRM|nr:MAG: hypothetical protein CfP315_0781 [Candidatus Improbicoccus pseudotrichonymphae]